MSRQTVETECPSGSYMELQNCANIEAIISSTSCVDFFPGLVSRNAAFCKGELDEQSIFRQKTSVKDCDCYRACQKTIAFPHGIKKRMWFRSHFISHYMNKVSTARSFCNQKMWHVLIGAIRNAILRSRCLHP